MKKMTNSYGKSRGDLTGATYADRVDVFYAGETSVDQWGRVGVRMETYWSPYGDGDTTSLAAEIAARVSGEVRSDFYDTYANGGSGYLWLSGYGKSIVVVPPESRADS